MRALATRVMSAHVMAGAHGRDPKRSVVDVGRHHQLGNLSVHDGSVFPPASRRTAAIHRHLGAARHEPREGLRALELSEVSLVLTGIMSLVDARPRAPRQPDCHKQRRTFLWRHDALGAGTARDYDPLSVVLFARRRRWLWDDGPRYSDMCRPIPRWLRLRPPAPHRRDDQAGSASRHLARVLQRPPAAFLASSAK